MQFFVYFLNFQCSSGAHRLPKITIRWCEWFLPELLVLLVARQLLLETPLELVLRRPRWCVWSLPELLVLLVARQLLLERLLELILRRPRWCEWFLPELLVVLVARQTSSQPIDSCSCVGILFLVSHDRGRVGGAVLYRPTARPIEALSLREVNPNPKTLTPSNPNPKTLINPNPKTLIKFSFLKFINLNPRLTSDRLAQPGSQKISQNEIA